MTQFPGQSSHTSVKTRIVVVLFVAAALIASAGTKQRRKTTQQRGSADRMRVVPRAEFDANAINNNQNQENVGPESRGSAVVRAQILSTGRTFLPARSMGHYGDNLRVAITGFQVDRKLSVSGVVDAATWKALNADPSPALVPYQLTPEDTDGPFEKVIPDEMAAQSKLAALGFTSPQELLGEKFISNPRCSRRSTPARICRSQESRFLCHTFSANISCRPAVLSFRRPGGPCRPCPMTVEYSPSIQPRSAANMIRCRSEIGK